MKITFLGAGSAFTKKNFNSCFVLETKDMLGDPHRLIVDCGRTAPEALAEAGLKWHDITSLYITHAHADHIGGVEEFAFSRMFIPPVKKPEIIGTRAMLEDLWDNSLKGGLGVGNHNKRMYLEDYFAVREVGEQFQIGDTTFRIVEVPHIMPTYGLFITTPESKRIFYSSDTVFGSHLFPYWEAAEMIFQDCETASYKSGVHAHYSDLCKLPDEIKGKMYLYHYQDGALPDALAAGFKGYVKKGQVFDL